MKEIVISAVCCECTLGGTVHTYIYAHTCKIESACWHEVTLNSVCLKGESIACWHIATVLG
jgi:hypothetical protein